MPNKGQKGERGENGHLGLRGLPGPPGKALHIERGKEVVTVKGQKVRDPACIF